MLWPHSLVCLSRFYLRLNGAVLLGFSKHFVAEYLLLIAIGFHHVDDIKTIDLPTKIPPFSLSSCEQGVKNTTLQTCR